MCVCVCDMVGICQIVGLVNPENINETHKNRSVVSTFYLGLSFVMSTHENIDLK